MNFHSRDFNFSARESIAILGIHSVIKHQSVNSIIVIVIVMVAIFTNITPS